MRSPLASPFRGGWRNLTPMRGRGRGGANPWTPAMLPPYAWYDAELGQPKNVGYVQLAGTAGDNVSTPDSAALSFSGDIEVVMRVRVTDWAAASNQTLCGKYVTTSNQRSWRFYANTSGDVGLTASHNGTAITSVIVTPTVALTDDAWIWLRLRLDLSNGANSVGTVETAADTGDNVEPSSWTANGTNTGVIIAGVFDSSAPLEIGSFANGASERLYGSVGRCIVRSGFAGTVVADFNADDCYGDGYTHTDGYRWTLGLPKIYDRSGNNHPPAVFGAGSNQPTWLPWDGTPLVYLPGASGNYVSCPDAAPLDITDDLEIVARVAMSDWTPGFNQSFVAKWNTGGNQACALQCAATTGRLRLYLSTTGSDLPLAESTVAPTVSDGSALWVKATFRLSDRRTQFFTAPDQASEPTTWTQLGSDVTHAATSIWAGSAAIEIGTVNAGSSSALTGEVYRAIVRNGIGGTTVADFDASLCGQSGYTDAYDNVWTVNRSTTGRKTVVQSPAAGSARSVILLGTDDWIDVPAAAIPALDTYAPPSAVSGAFRRWHNSGAWAAFSNKADSNNATRGIVMRTNATPGSGDFTIVAGDGANNDLVTGGTLNAALGLRSVLTAGVGNVSPIIEGVANGGAPMVDTTRTTMSTTNPAGPGRIGAHLNGTGAIDMEFEGLALSDGAVSDADHGQLVAYYGGGL